MLAALHRPLGDIVGIRINWTSSERGAGFQLAGLEESTPANHHSHWRERAGHPSGGAAPDAPRAALMVLLRQAAALPIHPTEHKTVCSAPLTTFCAPLTPRWHGVQLNHPGQQLPRRQQPEQEPTSPRRVGDHQVSAVCSTPRPHPSIAYTTERRIATRFRHLRTRYLTRSLCRPAYVIPTSRNGKTANNAEHIATAKRMKADGHTAKDIAKYLGVSRATLYRYLTDGAA